MYISVEKLCKYFLVIAFSFQIISCEQQEKIFQKKSIKAFTQLDSLKEKFEQCSSLANTNAKVMQSIVFPEVVRYNQLRDNIETESLKVLYVELGKEYANFSIGLFQMKPSFAEEVEYLALTKLSPSTYNELQLKYSTTIEEDIRLERIKRLEDIDWQLIYLTGFIAVCKEVYRQKIFTNELEEMKWYATIYNMGWQKDEVLAKRIVSDFSQKNGMRYTWQADYYYNFCYKQL